MGDIYQEAVIFIGIVSFRLEENTVSIIYINVWYNFNK
jgi:hypothetical protein